MFKFLLSVLLTVSVVGLLVAGGVQRGQDQTRKQGYRPGVLMVKFKAAAVSYKGFKVGRKTSGIASTGLSTIDALNRDAGVISVSQEGMYMPRKAELSRILGVDRIYYLTVSDKTADMVKLAEKYSADPNVEAANPDWELYYENIPNDPLYSNQWGHNNTAQMLSYNWSVFEHTGPPVGTVGFDANAQSAWDGSQAYGSSSIIIAIIDGGVNWAHPDLRIWQNDDPIDGVDNDGNGRIDDIRGWDFGSNDNNPDDNATGAGHGTSCAGIAAAIANNSLGVAGIGGGCTIMPLKGANNAGSLLYSSINNCIYYAADNGADVISMSLGSSSQDAANNTACTYAWNAGVVVLAATGNENNSSISYPARNTNCIAVGAASNCGDRKRSSSNTGELNPGVFADPNGYTCDGERWWGSNYGTTTPGATSSVDIIAPTILPTTDIVGSGGYNSGDYDLYFNGTSCATPYAAGVCGLILSKNPTWTPAQVLAQLTGTAIDIVNVESGAGFDRYSGYGMVDTAAAVGVGASPTVTLTAPNGGENWTVSSNQTITWNSTGTIANVSLDYSTNGGSNWTSITSSTPNDGSQSWTIPNAPTTTARVRVSDASNSSITDMSNANFTISAADVTPPVISNVQATGITSSGATVTWTTDEASNSFVDYGLTTSYGSTASTASMVTSHSVPLSGLTSNTLYHYRVRSSDASSNQATSGDFTFTTAVASFSPVESFADGNFTSNPTWAGSTTSWSVVANSDAGAGATGSNTLRLAAASGSGTKYLSTQRTASWGTEQSWSFWMGRRGQAATTTNYSVVWLYANASNVTASTIDGYRVLFGDNSGGDNIVLQRITNNSAATVITSSGTVANGRTDYGFMVRVTRTSGSVWTLYTSALPTANGTGAVASSQPTAANTNVLQGSGTNSTYTNFANGYFGFAATHTTASAARQAAEFDQLYFDVSATSPLSKIAPVAMLPTSESNEQTPTTFALHQNYPNPFNPSTSIRFELPVASDVTITIFNLFGQEVGRLLDAQEYNSGYHSVEFDASNLSSGTYFYRISSVGIENTTSFQSVKKMLFIK